jgi:ABC-type sugar transport system ATPase subunit
LGTKRNSNFAHQCGEGRPSLIQHDEELIGLCDRVLALYDGKIHTELMRQPTKENLISASLGGE